MFDSPFALCPERQCPVLLDQTQEECAREHTCDSGCACPLAAAFCGYDFKSPTNSIPSDRNKHEPLRRTS